MTNKMRTAALAASFLATLALAIPSRAPAAVSSTAQKPVRLHMDTRMYDIYHPFEIDGQMNLTVYPNGIVNGFYLPLDGHIRDVTGGVTGQTIWLDVGGVHSLHLTGTLKDGVLRTTAFIPGPDTWVFESTKTVRQTG